MITINGQSYKGNSVTIKNNKVIIDGKPVDTEDYKEISIVVEGNANSINVDACESIHVSGSCGTLKTMSGDVDCGNVQGSIKTMSGDVYANDVAGSVDTMSGDIKTVRK